MNENSISRLLQWENGHQIEINGSSKLCEQYTYNISIYLWSNWTVLILKHYTVETERKKIAIISYGRKFIHNISLANTIQQIWGEKKE